MEHPVTIQQLRYAVAVSESGSLNKASEILYIAQPSLTSAIQELEKELGITIFSRSGRGVAPTNDGTEFLLYARGVLHQYDELLERYRKSGSIKKKFGISTQHYSFAVKSFVELVKQYGTEKYLPEKVRLASCISATLTANQWKSCCAPTSCIFIC